MNESEKNKSAKHETVAKETVLDDSTTNVLIVDDEILVRLSLKTLIPWEAHGFRIAGEAQNGREALRLMESAPCQIVLTDIRMPELDGLSLIAEIRSRWPQTKCVILSNHNDFDYVQQALRLGAVDYVLKLAWVPEELLAMCRRLQDEVRQEALQLAAQDEVAFRLDRLDRETKDRLLLNLLTKQASRLEIERAAEGVELAFDTRRFKVALVSIDAYEAVLGENRFKSEQLLNYTVANVLGEILNGHGGGELVEISGGRFAIVASRILPELLEQLREATGAYVRISISCGVSAACSGLGTLQAGFEQAQRALERRFFRGEGAVVRADEAGAEARDPARPEQGDDAIGAQSLREFGIVDETRWQALLAAGEEAAVVREWARCCDRWQVLEAAGAEAVREELLRLLYLFGDRVLEPAGKTIYTVPEHEGRYPFDVIRNAQTLAEIRGWLGQWLALALRYAQEASGTRYRPEIQRVLEMIHQEYGRPLKVSDMARRAGFAENYLSVLFRKETGQKIVDYLTAVRMEKARELLRDPVYKIYEIAELVGYRDANHFSKYFKKIEGVFPLEFRKMAQRK
ncbi:response regulator [Paenibacillus sp. IB182496]|uniref:Response regulator n=1 Tax=Paenibacillus sabuli TaxID=2772509 RepID=A0A927GQY8_9BACL|nr:response regulator [Paenibacillus sabuli]MBD2845039.1 response regulator [Paenibacillus sabuli]